MQKQNAHKRSGFTLVELLVVIVILGILGTIGFSNFRGYFGRALDAERKAAVQAIGSMIKLKGATDFSSNKYCMSFTALGCEQGALAGNQFTKMLETNEYKLPLRESACLVYFYVDGTSVTSPNDNEFLIVAPLSEPEGDISGKTFKSAAFGAGSNISQRLDKIREEDPVDCESPTSIAANHYNNTGNITATKRIVIKLEDPTAYE